MVRTPMESAVLCISRVRGSTPFINVGAVSSAYARGSSGQRESFSAWIFWKWRNIS